MNKKNNKIRVIIFSVLCALQFFLVLAFYKTLDNDIKIRYALLNNVDVIEAKVENEVLELRNYYNNDDIVGKVNIDNTCINEPVLKYTDNSYYLTHDSYGNYDGWGSIYMDYRTSLGDRKILIFGHSSPSVDVPFNELENYYDKSFYQKHKYIELIGEEEKYQYEIFSVYVETSDFTYMNLKIDDETYNSDLNKYKKNSLYETGVSVGDNDHILILQTCSNNSKYKKYKKKYLLIIAKETNREVL